MSQYAMHMPGGQMQRRASMDVYTGLLLLTALALLTAVAFVYVQGAKVAAPNSDGSPGQPLTSLQQPGQIKLPNPPGGGR